MLPCMPLGIARDGHRPMVGSSPSDFELRHYVPAKRDQPGFRGLLAAAPSGGVRVWRVKATSCREGVMVLGISQPSHD